MGDGIGNRHALGRQLGQQFVGQYRAHLDDHKPTQKEDHAQHNAEHFDPNAHAADDGPEAARPGRLKKSHHRTCPNGYRAVAYLCAWSAHSVVQEANSPKTPSLQLSSANSLSRSHFGNNNFLYYNANLGLPQATTTLVLSKNRPAEERVLGGPVACGLACHASGGGEARRALSSS